MAMERLKVSKFTNNATENALELVTFRGYANQYQVYIPIAFDERVMFWLQSVLSLPCVCTYVAFFACDARV